MRTTRLLNFAGVVLIGIASSSVRRTESANPSSPGKGAHRRLRGDVRNPNWPRAIAGQFR